MFKKVKVNHTNVLIISIKVIMQFIKKHFVMQYAFDMVGDHPHSFTVRVWKGIQC